MSCGWFDILVGSCSIFDSQGLFGGGGGGSDYCGLCNIAFK